MDMAIWQVWRISKESLGHKESLPFYKLWISLCLRKTPTSALSKETSITAWLFLETNNLDFGIKAFSNLTTTKNINNNKKESSVGLQIVFVSDMIWFTQRSEIQKDVMQYYLPTEIMIKWKSIFASTLTIVDIHLCNAAFLKVIPKIAYNKSISPARMIPPRVAFCCYKFCK